MPTPGVVPSSDQRQTKRKDKTMENRRILVIDDSPTMRQLLRMTLKRRLNVEIVEANDGVEGLKMLENGKFDLIFTDINMPMMDGFTLVSLVKQNPSIMDIPIVILTTEGRNQEIEKGKELGVEHYLTKPINPVKLIFTTRDLLNLN